MQEYPRPLYYRASLRLERTGPTGVALANQGLQAYKSGVNHPDGMGGKMESIRVIEYKTNENVLVFLPNDDVVFMKAGHKLNTDQLAELNTMLPEGVYLYKDMLDYPEEVRLMVHLDGQSGEREDFALEEGQNLRALIDSVFTVVRRVPA